MTNPSAKRVASRYAIHHPGEVRDDNERVAPVNDEESDTASQVPGSSDSPVKESEIEPPENGTL